MAPLFFLPNRSQRLVAAAPQLRRAAGVLYLPPRRRELPVLCARQSRHVIPAAAAAHAPSAVGAALSCWAEGPVEACQTAAEAKLRKAGSGRVSGGGEGGGRRAIS